MEQTDVQNVENTEEVTTENTESQTAEKNVKTFATQEDFNKALEKAIARKIKGMPTGDELKIFNEWKESKKTEEQKQNEIKEENKALKAEVAELKNMQAISEAGVDFKFQKFVLSEVLENEGDFKENLNEYLKENPQFLKQKEVAETPKNTGVAVNKISENANSGVGAILKAKHPELFKE